MSENIPIHQDTYLKVLRLLEANPQMNQREIFDDKITIFSPGTFYGNISVADIQTDNYCVNEVGYWTNRPDSSLRAQRSRHCERSVAIQGPWIATAYSLAMTKKWIATALRASR